MSTEQTAQTTAAPVEAAKPGPKIIGKASDLLTQQETTANPANAGTAGTGVNDAAKQKTEGDTVAEHLSKLAAARREFDAEKKAHEATKAADAAAAAETAKKAAAWDAL